MKRLCLFLLPLMIVISCYFPPYNEEVSLGARTAKDLEKRAVVGPVDFEYYDFQNRTVRFSPSKDGMVSGNEFLRGFIAGYDDYSARLVYINHNLTPDTDYYVSFDTMEPVNNNDEKEFSFAMSTVEDGMYEGSTQELFGLAVFDPKDEATRGYVMYDGGSGTTVAGVLLKDELDMASPLVTAGIERTRHHVRYDGTYRRIPG